MGVILLTFKERLLGRELLLATWRQAWVRAPLGLFVRGSTLEVAKNWAGAWFRASQPCEPSSVLSAWRTAWEKRAGTVSRMEITISRILEDWVDEWELWHPGPPNQLLPFYGSRQVTAPVLESADVRLAALWGGGEARCRRARRAEKAASVWLTSYFGFFGRTVVDVAIQQLDPAASDVWARADLVVTGASEPDIYVDVKNLCARPPRSGEPTKTFGQPLIKSRKTVDSTQVRYLYTRTSGDWDASDATVTVEGMVASDELRGISRFLQEFVEARGGHLKMSFADTGRNGRYPGWVFDLPTEYYKPVDSCRRVLRLRESLRGSSHSARSDMNRLWEDLEHDLVSRGQRVHKGHVVPLLLWGFWRQSPGAGRRWWVDYSRWCAKSYWPRHWPFGIEDPSSVISELLDTLHVISDLPLPELDQAQWMEVSSRGTVSFRDSFGRCTVFAYCYACGFGPLVLGQDSVCDCANRALRCSHCGACFSDCPRGDIFRGEPLA